MRIIDAEIIKNGTSYLVSNNIITGTSLEVLSFMVSSIKKDAQNDRSDGRPGRINFGQEDDYRTVRMAVEGTAVDLHDIAHLRDAINQLFDGEFYIREKRIKDIAIEYESPGQKTGELNLGESECVNGKQLYVAHIGDIDIDDSQLSFGFDVEMETVALPYFESIYTTLELHDSGYSSTKEKYGLVDNIDDEKVKYRFEPSVGTINIATLNYDYGFINGSGVVSQLGTGPYTINTGFINIIPGVEYQFIDEGDHPRVAYWWIIQYDIDQNFIDRTAINSSGNGKDYTFTAKGSKLKIMLNPTSPLSDNRIPPSRVGNDVLPRLKTKASAQQFSVYNAGNVAVAPESMFLEIEVHGVYSIGNLKIINRTTGEEFALQKSARGFNLRLHGMVVTQGGSINIFRDTNHQFISLAPGVNHFETTGGTFDNITFNFKFYNK